MQANAPFSDVQFIRTDVLHARRGIIVQSTEGPHTMRRVSFEDIAVEELAGTPSVRTCTRSIVCPVC